MPPLHVTPSMSSSDDDSSELVVGVHAYRSMAGAHVPVASRPLDAAMCDDDAGMLALMPAPVLVAVLLAASCAGWLLAVALDVWAAAAPCSAQTMLSRCLVLPLRMWLNAAAANVANDINRATPAPCSGIA